MNVQFSIRVLFIALVLASVRYGLDVNEEKNIANINLSLWTVTTPDKLKETHDFNNSEILHSMRLYISLSRE
ncbi:hypothetical protein M2326_002686 [Flavobacterium sp. 7A]|nr:hypothetical protein [Flavobacterium sp. 7A]